jgi:hypothetical protein
MSNDKSTNLEDLLNSESTTWEKKDIEPEKNDVPIKESNLGRPKVSASKRMKPRFSVNLNDVEFERLKKHCEDMGIPLSQFTRMKLLEALRVS